MTNDKAIELAALFSETRIAMEAVRFGIEAFTNRTGNTEGKSELTMLCGLTNQACEALEILQRSVLGEPTAQ